MSTEPTCDLCGEVTCPDSDQPGFSEPRDCALTPIYKALRYDRCEYGCGRDVTKETIRRDIAPTLTARLAAVEAERDEWIERAQGVEVGLIHDATEQITAERDRLAHWKAEALPVLDGLQEIGKALNLPLGQRITGPQALKAIEALLAERDRLAAAVERVRALDLMCTDGCVGPGLCDGSCLTAALSDAGRGK